MESDQLLRFQVIPAAGIGGTSTSSRRSRLQPMSIELIATTIWGEVEKTLSGKFTYPLLYNWRSGPGADL